MKKLQNGKMPSNHYIRFAKYDEENLQFAYI